MVNVGKYTIHGCYGLYWLFNSDPYNGLLQSRYNWVGFHPLYTRINQGQLVTAHMVFQN